MVKYGIAPQLYVSSSGNRYVLGIRGTNTLVVFGLNPSTADKMNPDRTIKRIERIASKLGFDSWLMLNLYPKKETEPSLLPHRINKMSSERNFAEIEKVLKTVNAYTLCAAWGNPITSRDFFGTLLKDLLEIKMLRRQNWHSFGSLTKAGHPRHPSRLSKANQSLCTFDIGKYSKS